MLGSDSGSFCAVYPTSSSAFFPLFFFYYELSHCGKNPLPSWSVQNHRVSSLLALEIEARGWVGVRGGCAVGVTQGHPSRLRFFTFDVGQPDFVAFFFNTPKHDDSSSETTKRTWKTAILKATPTRVGAAEEAGNEREGLPPFVKKPQRRSRPCTSAQMTQRGGPFPSLIAA